MKNHARVHIDELRRSLEKQLEAFLQSVGAQNDADMRNRSREAIVTSHIELLAEHVDAGGYLDAGDVITAAAHMHHTSLGLASAAKASWARS